jgi:predicted RNase H-like HicB family nuclease
MPETESLVRNKHLDENEDGILKLLNNRCLTAGAAFLCAALLSACGTDEALIEYQDNMTTFFEEVSACNDGMNSIDASSDDAAEQLLMYLDQLNDEVAWMAELEVPEQFSAADSLADEASENMQQAVELYHQVYENGEYDEAIAEAAGEYYDRANIRIQYIITILHGEIPEGEGVTYTEENSILGGGYLNQTDEEETE